MATEIVATTEFAEWYEGLTVDERTSIIRVVTLLRGVVVAPCAARFINSSACKFP